MQAAGRCGLMSKKNLISRKQTRLSQAKVQAKVSELIPYRQPEVYYLGSWEQVQGAYQGRMTDGVEGYYYSC